MLAPELCTAEINASNESIIKLQKYPGILNHDQRRILFQHMRRHDITTISYDEVLEALLECDFSEIPHEVDQRLLLDVDMDATIDKIDKEQEAKTSVFMHDLARVMRDADCDLITAYKGYKDARQRTDRAIAYIKQNKIKEAAKKPHQPVEVPSTSTVEASPVIPETEAEPAARPGMDPPAFFNENAQAGFLHMVDEAQKKDSFDHVGRW